ncbi:MAG: haloacid dehalogenase-like hydrolase, partial [Planctomycetaceae bacterium]|nr:haloacid dehalogenase-like hydrolase [Planctomycetaceae bacterium]
MADTPADERSRRPIAFTLRLTRLVLLRSTLFVLPGLSALNLAGAALADDPLPSWNDCRTKQALHDFVTRVTDANSPDFVPVAERILVTDNDGCLWPENPVPFQLAFVLDELKRLAPQHPEWKENQTIQAALADDLHTIIEGGIPALGQLLAVTHSGMTDIEFEARVNNWLQTASHPRFHRPYHHLGYLPMREALDYLRANGFKTYIVSGGGADFMRVWTEDAYGIPPEQVIGSYASARYELRDDGPVLIKEPKIELVDDKAGKPVGIHRFIGRRPIVCFGNSDGDQA